MYSPIIIIIIIIIGPPPPESVSHPSHPVPVILQKGGVSNDYRSRQYRPSNTQTM